MDTIEKQIAALEAKTKIQLIRNPIFLKHDDWKKTAHEWLVVFDGKVTTSYYTGLGHRVGLGYTSRNGYSYKELSGKNLTQHGFEQLLQCSKPKAPTLKDILYSLQSDASAVGENFEEWCNNLGYSSDSIKAMEIYKACIETAGLLRGLGFNLKELQEYFQDY